MNGSIQIIPYSNLALTFIPALVVVGIMYKWTGEHRTGLYALTRMLGQLLLLGYFLSFIFRSESGMAILAVAAAMVFVSSWIALRTVRTKRYSLYTKAFGALLLGGGSTLLLITQGVLNLDPWYYPNYFIPLAGMIFANAMNSISLAADRLDAEISRTKDFVHARNIAFRSSLIPITNSLFAVGLVSIPGMMTGQILSGESPLIAARYQIMVMCMVFGSAGIASACFLTMVREEFTQEIPA